MSDIRSGSNPSPRSCGGTQCDACVAGAVSQGGVSACHGMPAPSSRSQTPDVRRLKAPLQRRFAPRVPPQAGGREEAVTSDVRYQKWFKPVPPVFRGDAMRRLRSRRCVAGGRFSLSRYASPVFQKSDARRQTSESPPAASLRSSRPPRKREDRYR